RRWPSVWYQVMGSVNSDVTKYSAREQPQHITGNPISRPLVATQLFKLDNSIKWKPLLDAIQKLLDKRPEIASIRFEHISEIIEGI
ncbi:hypothetical protein IWW36_000369, partial [Coemansia brasiliensis]